MAANTYQPLAIHINITLLRIAFASNLGDKCLPGNKKTPMYLCI